MIAHLMVQAAVPLLGIDDRRGLLLGLLRDAINEAERFARLPSTSPTMHWKVNPIGAKRLHLVPEGDAR